MKEVVKAIDARQKEFAELPFFQRLSQAGTQACLLAFAPGLTFFTLVFQDILRLSEARMTDPTLQVIAREHRMEEKGHDAWFLRDMERFGSEHDLEWAFSDAHKTTRDMSYALVAEVFRATDDRVRIALLWVLEATGDVFFSRIPKYVESTGYDGPSLDYFSWRHHAAEQSHQIVDRALRERMEAYALPEAVREEALGMMDRAFAAFTTMFVELERVVARVAREEEARETTKGPPSRRRPGAPRS